ncbi:Na(+)/H(+) exchange regulatory cofactor NHE-RF1a [Colossoma macropomum]|uniref:Na(+)/H(+) exchange regulatory cofactor NHE-RF1a n=1 Tax=Colossoma macropomum TaxID=42526 RepID=UPI00186526B2|nr:Na(+)/H(+) exchange regulatory cofactor NHE-RF1a [Colossoma macropomum]
MSGDLRPRLCVLEKGSDGYGFHLHGEKGKAGQFIRLVEPGSPADSAGLQAGDRVAFVNGESVEGESHQQVVSRIRAVTGKLELVVVDDETQELLAKLNLKCQKEFVTDGIPSADGEPEPCAELENGTPRQESPAPDTNGDSAAHRLSVSSKDSKNELRPRLCHMKKGATGYGFNLHSEKSKPGQYIRAVDEDSPAEKSGLRPQDKVVQVNGVSVQSMQHSEVVAAIKAGGDELRLLVVDPDADAFFSSCGVLPTEEHLTGPLPEPAASGESAEVEVKEEEAQEAKPKISASPSTSSTSSTASIPAATVSSPPPEEKPEEKRLSGDASLDLDLNMSLQQAKERAHQKRSNKRAPPMDWSKRSELFSNL